MAIVECGGCKIWIDISVPKTLNEFPVNVYRDAADGEEYDAETLPPEARGHIYTISKTTAPLGLHLGRTVAVVENVYRAWDEESYPILKKCKAESALVHTAVGERKRMYMNNPLPLSAIGSTVFIPVEATGMFIDHAQKAGWNLEFIWFDETMLCDMEAFKTGMGKDLDEDRRVLEYFGKIVLNRYDPYFVDHPKDFVEAQALLNEMNVLFGSFTKSGADFDTVIRNLLQQIKTVFPWASTATVSGDSIKIYLVHGSLTLSKDAITYASEGKEDSLVVKGAVTRLGKLLKRKRSE